VLDVPIPIIRPPLDEIDPTSIVCQGLCPEGLHQGTVSKIVSVIVSIFCRRLLLL